VFERALAKDPSARYATCGEFVGDLRDALHSSAGATVALPPPPPSQMPRTVRTRRRTRLPLVLAAVAAAAVAGVVAALVVDRGAPTDVRTVTLPGTTLRQTVTSEPPPPSPPPPASTAPPPPPATAPPPPPAADGHTLNDQGYARMRAGDYEGALPLLERAVVLLRGTGPADPYEGYANYNLGYTLVHVGRCHEALTYLQVADRLEPGNADVHRAIHAARTCS
jgi:tetratricopeptide (TPR) repeat protein